jgi:hypothetical protein
VRDREDSGLEDLALELGLGELGDEVANGEDYLHTGGNEDVEPGARGWRGGRRQAGRSGYGMARSAERT